MLRSRHAKITRHPSPYVFRRAVLRWYESNGRDLPWRRTRDPWLVLMSEVMLQQTQVGRVIPKYETFVRRWPTPAAMAKARLADVLKEWSGLGYNRRAAHLKEAAGAIVATCDGSMPEGREALEALPGVGRYTARAVASFAYNTDSALWDTNVRRIALRFFFGGEFAANAADDEALEKTLEAALPKGRSRDWHGALMDFGSAVCLGRAPKCGACPLARTCLASPSFLSGRMPKRRLVRPQTRFEGSRRQARGAVIRLLAGAGRGGMDRVEAVRRLGRADSQDVIDALADEGLVVRRGRRIMLP